MAEYKFDDIAINSTAKKKPVEEDKYHYCSAQSELGLFYKS